MPPDDNELTSILGNMGKPNGPSLDTVRGVAMGFRISAGLFRNCADDLLALSVEIDEALAKHAAARNPFHIQH